MSAPRTCPKCGATSGNDWSQCPPGELCPMRPEPPLTDHYVPVQATHVTFVCPVEGGDPVQAKAIDLRVNDGSYHEASHSAYSATCVCEVLCPKCGKRHEVEVYG